MPRENRKRGKKHRKAAAEQEPTPQAHATPVGEDNHPGSSRPSWIIPAPAPEDVHSQAPFGYVDADVKAYFRNVDEQMKSWQESTNSNVDQDSGPNEDRRMFFMAALGEMTDKEKLLATDPDCSIILERMSYSMDDFVRRVFMDKLSGAYELLVKHRFASHVCQTLFSVVADTVSRESQGVFPIIPEGSGELRTASELILDIFEELRSSFVSLILDPFASHALRAILLLLSPSVLTSQQHSNLRSKRSTAWKAKQGPLKSVFGHENTSIPSTRHVPPTFHAISRQIVQLVRDQLNENEVRALAASKVASPVLQILLEIEAEQGICNEPRSLMDRVLVGMISSSQNGPPEQYQTSDYLDTLLRDPTSSHLLETLVSRSPHVAFDVLWRNYFRGKLSRLAVHPVANFVVAKTLERLNSQQLTEACDELSDAWIRVIRASRSGVLRSLIERASSLKSTYPEVEEAVLTAFGLTTEEHKRLLVPCCASLLPISDYVEAQKRESSIAKSNHKQSKPTDNLLAPKVQGTLLLQGLLHFPEPCNRIVLDSIFAMSIQDCITLSHHPAGSRVLDALLESPTVSFKDKRRFVMLFIGHYHRLVDDRIGSRVGDRCWAFADTYLKEKIARSLIPFESSLSSSYYGKFFARNLNLYLLQRKPEEWKTLQSQRRKGPQSQTTTPPSKSLLEDTIPSGSRKPSQPSPEGLSQPSEGGKGKRARYEDEIDALFDCKLGKRVKRATLTSDVELLASRPLPGQMALGDPSLDDVLGAIRSASTFKNHHPGTVP